jgi:hypothetical protein
MSACLRSGFGTLLSTSATNVSILKEDPSRPFPSRLIQLQS